MALLLFGSAGGVSYVTFFLAPVPDWNLSNLLIVVCVCLLATGQAGRGIIKLTKGGVPRAWRRAEVGILIAGLVLAGVAIWLSP